MWIGKMGQNSPAASPTANELLGDIPRRTTTANSRGGAKAPSRHCGKRGTWSQPSRARIRISESVSQLGKRANWFVLDFKSSWGGTQCEHLSISAVKRHANY